MRQSGAEAALRNRLQAFVQAHAEECAALSGLEPGVLGALRELAAYFDEEFDARDPTRCVWGGGGGGVLWWGVLGVLRELAACYVKGA